MRIDFHTHAFPDALAAKAIPALEAHLPRAMHARFDGRLATLVAELESHDFDAAVLAPIATRPAQFAPILEWSCRIRDGGCGAAAARRIVPLASVHPADPDRFAHLRQIAAAGLRGIKLHPYYQDFVLDDPAVLDLLRAARDLGLLVLCHVGFDAAAPRQRVCDPARVARALDAVPDVEFVAAHLGGWDDWEEAARLLIGRPVTLDISLVFGLLDAARLREMLLRHPADRLLFGTDWPWHSHAEILPQVAALGLEAERLAALMGGNAARLLRLAATPPARRA